VVFTEWLFFAVVAVGLVVLRRRAGYAPAYRVPGVPVLPLAFAAAALFVAVSQIAAQPRDSAAGLLLVLAGLPIYVWWTRRRPAPGATPS
jgi:APA family basic amino acid/polyamine antiporter